MDQWRLSRTRYLAHTNMEFIELDRWSKLRIAFSGKYYREVDTVFCRFILYIAEGTLSVVYIL